MGHNCPIQQRLLWHLTWSMVEVVACPTAEVIKWAHARTSCGVLLKGIIMAFVPIEISEFVKLQIKQDPSDDQADLISRLEITLDAFNRDQRCQCGGIMWVIGSAMAGWSACFTCITGEADSSDDYEIAEACEIR